MGECFKYKFGDKIDFSIKEGSFISIVGNTNDLIIYTLLNEHKKCEAFIGDKKLNKENITEIRKRMYLVLYKHLDIFVGETVKDEIAFGLESLGLTKDDIINKIDSYASRFKIKDILEKDPYSIGSSDKAKVKILNAIILGPNILILDNILPELDINDRKIVLELLDEYKKNKGIIINFTNNIEETLYGDEIIVIHDKCLICSGKTMSVLNEEKILKRLGLNLPFIIDLNRYFMDYGMINKYYLELNKLVGELWK